MTIKDLKEKALEMFTMQESKPFSYCYRTKEIDLNLFEIDNYEDVIFYPSTIGMNYSFREKYKSSLRWCVEEYLINLFKRDCNENINRVYSVEQIVQKVSEVLYLRSLKHTLEMCRLVEI